ncbi:MAG: alpha/beta hydrolase [Alphaproteobacteria bacterium]|nr:alpha/beta hydrolase [Alphaproteobacteria bacterium]
MPVTEAPSLEGQDKRAFFRGRHKEPQGADRPAIDSRFHEFSGWRWGSFLNAEGVKLRFGWADPSGPIRATVVTLPGFGGFAEQWFELFNDLLARGFAVRHLDWRGQGGSQRYLKNPHKMHSTGYDKDVADLQRFINRAMRRDTSKPMFVVAHSMGAHIALRYVSQHPGRFAFAVFTAPMFQLRNLARLPRLSHNVVRAMVALGLAERYVLGQSDWIFRPEYSVEISKLSQDPIRYRIGQLYFLHKPELRVGGATWRWLLHSLRSIREVNSEQFLKSVATPILIATGGKDEHVDNNAIVRAARLLPQARLVPFAEAKHDLWLEKDEIRSALLAQLDAFAAAQLSG